MSINAGSVSVDVVPDATGFATKLRAKLGNLAVQVLAELDDKEADVKLAALTRERDATVNADADTAKAEAELDHAARNRTSKIDVDTRNGIRHIGLLTTAIIGLGPALVPVTAGVIGLAGALGTPIAAAGGGLTIFGLIAGKAISDTNKVVKQIDALKTKAATLVDPKARADARAQAKALEDSLTGAQRKFVEAENSLKAGFADLTKRLGPSIFGPFTKGLGDLTRLLPRVSPLTREVSGALSVLLDDLDRSAKSGSLSSFLRFMTRAAGPDMLALGHIFGNISSGLLGIIQALAPLSGSVLRGLERMTADFADFGQHAGSNSGFQSFLDYVREEGPEVVHLLGSLAGAVVAIARAAAPLGGVVVRGLTVLADTLKVIADSPAGPILFGAAAGLLAINRAMVIGAGIKNSPILQLLTGEKAFGGLSRLQLGLAGLGGALSILGSKAGDAGKGVGVLGDALTGASLGSAFGPWGAAIGGAGGALIGLIANIHHSDTVIGKSKPIVSDYANTFDRLTGAITNATRAQVYNDLQKSGAVKAAQDLGLSTKTLTDAALGNAHAQQQVSDALANARRNVLLLQGAQRRDFANKTAYMEYKKQIDALEGSYNLVKGSVDQTSAAIRRQQKDARDARGALINYTNVFKGFPKQAVTEIKTEGIPSSKAAIVDLARRYNLTPKQIHTLVSVSGTGPVIAQIRQVQAEMNALHDKTVNLTVIRHSGGGQSRPMLADGGTVPGIRMPYYDKVHALVAPGEEIISNRNGQADRFRADRAAGRIPNYGNGGTVARAQRTVMAQVAQVRAANGGTVPTASGAPDIVVGGPRVQVFIDGQEVRAIVREEQAAGRSYEAARARQRVGA